MTAVNHEKVCKNCQYYIAIYTKEKTRFKTILGYCVNDKKCARRRKFISFNGGNCEFWEQSENLPTDQNKSVREVIITMQKQLTQLLELLENDE